MLDVSLLRDLGNRALSQDILQDFFVVLALCNTVVLSRRTQEFGDGE